MTPHPIPLPRSSRLPLRGQLPTAPRPLHIVMVGWEWPPHHTGGLGVHCYELAKELTKLGHRITFLTPFTGPFTPVEGVTVRYPGSPEGGKPSEFPPAYWAGNVPGSPFWNATDGYNTWVVNLGDLTDVDVIHVHDWFGTEGAIGLARRLGRPLVMTVHSTEYRPFPRQPLGSHPRPRATRDRCRHPGDRGQPAPPAAADRPVSGRPADGSGSSTTPFGPATASRPSTRIAGSSSSSGGSRR